MIRQAPPQLGLCAQRASIVHIWGEAFVLLADICQYNLISAPDSLKPLVRTVQIMYSCVIIISSSEQASLTFSVISHRLSRNMERITVAMLLHNHKLKS